MSLVGLVPMYFLVIFMLADYHTHQVLRGKKDSTFIRFKVLFVAAIWPAWVPFWGAWQIAKNIPSATAAVVTWPIRPTINRWKGE